MQQPQMVNNTPHMTSNHSLVKNKPKKGGGIRGAKLALLLSDQRSRSHHFASVKPSGECKHNSMEDRLEQRSSRRHCCSLLV